MKVTLPNCFAYHSRSTNASNTLAQLREKARDELKHHKLNNISVKLRILQNQCYFTCCINNEINKHGNSV